MCRLSDTLNTPRSNDLNTSTGRPTPKYPRSGTHVYGRKLINRMMSRQGCARTLTTLETTTDHKSCRIRSMTSRLLVRLESVKACFYSGPILSGHYLSLNIWDSWSAQREVAAACAAMLATPSLNSESLAMFFNPICVLLIQISSGTPSR